MSESEKSSVNEIGGIPIRSEDIGFAAGEMAACSGCGRMNPPTRLTCMYCGAEMSIAQEFADQVRPLLRRLEAWENGFNVIVTGRTDDGEAISWLARLLSADAALIRSVFDASCPMPIARVETKSEADIIAAAFESRSVSCRIIGDAELTPDKPPVRLRSIEFGENVITLIWFNGTGRSTISRDDLALIVPGIIAENKTELLEKKGRRGSSTVTDEADISFDSAVLDIYSRQDADGSRILLSGFDFSCLGVEKGVIAAENLVRLRKKLAEFAPNAKVVANYDAVRPELSTVWEIDTRKDTQGLKRSGFAKFEFGSVSLSSNLTQLNRYSRLQWHLL